jgi:putative sugar O-methyltransferase
VPDIDTKQSDRSKIQHYGETSDSSSDLNALMLKNYVLAKQDYIPQHKSKHWDHLLIDNYEEVIKNTEVWRDFRNCGISRGLDDTARAPVVSSTVKPEGDRRLLEVCDSLCSTVGVEFVRNFHEAEIGNPPYLLHEGMRLNLHDFSLIYYAWQLRNFLPEKRDERLVFVDIGGGYGGLVAKLKRLYPNSLCILFDLPEVNVIQAYYINGAFPDARIFYYIDYKSQGIKTLVPGAYDFAILPGWTISGLPGKFVDLVINTRSMMEMNLETINFYFSEIQRIVKPGGMFYCVNRYSKSTVGQSIRIKDYPFDDKWFLALSQPSWNQPWIHELLAVRTATANAFPVCVDLAKLPPYSVAEVLRQIRQVLLRLIVIIVGEHPHINPGLRFLMRNKRFLSKGRGWFVAKARQHSVLMRGLLKRLN